MFRNPHHIIPSKALIFPAILLVVFSTMVTLQLSGSSIGMDWYFLYGEVESDPNLLLGSPRVIRSDEYAVETPWTIMESRVDFNERNPFIGSGQDLILTDVPIRHWSLIFTPQNWGYFVLPLENAFSYHWWFKGLILILGVYLLAMKLLKGNYFLSALIAISAWFSPAIQWWYTTSLVETFGYFFLLLYLIIQIIQSQTIRALVLYSGALTYGIGCFMFLGYIPALIPTALALFFLAIGLLLERFLHNVEDETLQPSSSSTFRARFHYAWKRTLFPKALAALLIVLVINLTVLLIFYLADKLTIDLVMSSVYPGARRELGGDMQVGHFLGGFYNIQLLWDAASYLTLGNQSEASSFFMLSIFLLPVFIFQQAQRAWRKKPLDYFLFSAILFYLLALCWAFIGLPQGLARLVLLDRVPAYRMILTFGALNLFLILYYLGQKPLAKTSGFRLFTLAYALIISLQYFHAGYRIQTQEPEFFFSPYLIYLIPVFVFLLLVTLLNYSKLVFAVALLALSLLTSFYVNPLYRGLSTIRETEIAHEIERIASQPENEDALWVFYDTVLSNYAAANGAQVLSATQYHPQPDLWKIFDPAGQYSDIYNRYAHIQLNPSPNAEIRFSLERSDAMLITIHPCNPAFEKANAHIFVFHEPVNYSCLQLIQAVLYPNTSFYIYDRVNTTSTP